VALCDTPLCIFALVIKGLGWCYFSAVKVRRCILAGYRVPARGWSRGDVWIGLSGVGVVKYWVCMFLLPKA
jgi:hypothetical protein